MFKFNDVNGVKYMTISAFEETNLVNHAFSTRIGGVSMGEAAALNLGFNRKDSVENIYENFRLLCGAAGVDDKSLVMAKQVHGSKVYSAQSGDAGRRIDGVDALITNSPDVAICTFHADCIPIFFLDPIKKVIGLAHSGWRGTVANIARKTVEEMESKYNCRPNDILAAIGPSIGVCHFEVDAEVAALFGEEYITGGEKPRIDLRRVCFDSLTAAGVPTPGITLTDICTYCSNDIFFSYRGDNKKTGSMAAVMQLRGD